MRLVIRVKAVKGHCPVYAVGGQIVLDGGYRFNLPETTNVCMHSLASVLPCHIALSKGIGPEQMGLAHKARKDAKAYVQWLGVRPKRPHPAGPRGIAAG